MTTTATKTTYPASVAQLKKFLTKGAKLHCTENFRGPIPEGKQNRTVVSWKGNDLEVKIEATNEFSYLDLAGVTSKIVFSEQGFEIRSGGLKLKYLYGWREVPIDIRLIAINQTEYWELKDEDGYEHIERIETVFFYDANRSVRACEFTPSYELHPVETRAIYKEGVPNDVKEKFDDIITSQADHEVEYHHVRDLNALAEQLKGQGFRYRELEASDFSSAYDEEDDYDQRVEKLVEYFRCNVQL